MLKNRWVAPFVGFGILMRDATKGAGRRDGERGALGPEPLPPLGEGLARAMRVVIGVDSGGSTTRALAVSLSGERVAYVETGGGNPSHDAEAGANLREAIRRAGEGHEVVRVVAGVAGLDRSEDEARVAEAAGLACPGTFVNDATVAHFAAFGEGPGIVSIQGTGSMIAAMLENGRVVKSGEFFHYAASGAVRVGIAGIQMLLTSPNTREDAALWDAAFGLWEADSVEGLREALVVQRTLAERERSRRHGTFARAVTASAEAGWAHSLGVCYRAGREIGVGIRLLGPLFAGDEVPVALVGACGRSAPIRRAVERHLAKARDRRYVVVESEISPVEGAARMALRAATAGT